jgi:hypothetical protein
VKQVCYDRNQREVVVVLVILSLSQVQDFFLRTPKHYSKDFVVVIIAVVFPLLINKNKKSSPTGCAERMWNCLYQYDIMSVSIFFHFPNPLHDCKESRAREQ